MSATILAPTAASTRVSTSISAEAKRVLRRGFRVDPRSLDAELDQALPGLHQRAWRRAYFERLEQTRGWSQREWFTAARLVEDFHSAPEDLIPDLDPPYDVSAALLARARRRSLRPLGDSYPMPVLLRALGDSEPALRRTWLRLPFVAPFDLVAWGPGWHDAYLRERTCSARATDPSSAYAALLRTRQRLGDEGLEIASCLLADGFDGDAEHLLEVSRTLA